MTLTAKIGPVPQAWRQQQPAVSLGESALSLLVLCVDVRSGMSSVRDVLATSYSRSILESALAKWLEDPGNSSIFLRHEIRKIPLLTGDKL